MATAKQITKRLEKAGISLNGLEISNNEIEICLGYTEKFNGVRNIGDCDEKQVKRMKKQLQVLFPEFTNSYKTNYGAIVLNDTKKDPNFNAWID